MISSLPPGEVGPGTSAHRCHLPAVSATGAAPGRADPDAVHPCVVTDVDHRGQFGLQIQGEPLFAPGLGKLFEQQAQIARLGTFRGHPQGPVEFTVKVFEELTQRRGVTVPTMAVTLTGERLAVVRGILLRTLREVAEVANDTARYAG